MKKNILIVMVFFLIVVGCDDEDLNSWEDHGTITYTINDNPEKTQSISETGIDYDSKYDKWTFYFCDEIDSDITTTINDIIDIEFTGLGYDVPNGSYSSLEDDSVSFEIYILDNHKCIS